MLELLVGAFLKFADPVEQDSGPRLAVHSPFVADIRPRKKLRVATASYYPLALVPSAGGQVVGDLKKTMAGQQLGRYSVATRVANYLGGGTRMVPKRAMSADELPT